MNLEFKTLTKIADKIVELKEPEIQLRDPTTGKLLGRLMAGSKAQFLAIHDIPAGSIIAVAVNYGADCPTDLE